MKKTLFYNTFISKHGKCSEEIFPSKIELIVFEESLAKWKLLHFLMAKSVPQLSMREAHCIEITLHGFPNPNANFFPWVEICIWKKQSRNMVFKNAFKT